MAINYRRIGAKIQYYRLIQGITQEGLAEAAAVSRRYISDLELGKKGVSLETLITVVNILKVSVDDVLSDSLVEKQSSILSIHFDIFGDCSKDETDFLLDILKEVKQIIRDYHVSK